MEAVPPPQDPDITPPDIRTDRLTDDLATFVIQHRRGIVGWISVAVLAGLLYLGLMVRGLGVNPLAPQQTGSDRNTTTDPTTGH
ncbi:MAG: hypothetical protein ACK5PP_16365 [Acidimicrobiales bacterium]